MGGLAEAIATTPGAGYTSEHLPTAECPLDLVDGAARYGLGIAIKVLLADDAALELVDEGLQIAERSADDFALGHARYALGLALMHRDSVI